MAGLTTHVLDTNQGKPAKSMKIDLFKIELTKRFYLGTYSTNNDGRVDSPLIMSEDLEVTTYEILFHAGEYLKKENPNSTSTLFLDIIPIRFNVTNNKEHYHVPLLLSSYSYSTYKGS
ncbi:MAG: hydroxyisourate hydrolase [Proteobacteria bacterium]|nr:hydroxyisourate hydrolase [Pseudomonadota bacterium]MDA1135704.1 hydroxyisourate hydrolase [Pseudomonadota bacterium]